MCNDGPKGSTLSGGFRQTADEVMADKANYAQQQNAAGQLGLAAGAQQAQNFDYEMQQRRLANVARQLQFLAQEGHSKGIYILVHKHSQTLSGGIVIVEYGPFTLTDLVTWAEKLARFDSFSFKFAFPRLDSY